VPAYVLRAAQPGKVCVAWAEAADVVAAKAVSAMARYLRIDRLCRADELRRCAETVDASRR
jgi:hypothetical protein